MAKKPASSEKPGKSPKSKAHRPDVQPIGPALADRILEFRQTNGPFQKAEDLERVYGIGPKKRQQIEPYLLFP